MGYVHRAGSLVCDKCSSTGARKRLCPCWVTEPDGQRLRYCSPLALCGGCFAEIGGSAKLHAKCKAGAAEMQAKNDEKSARLAAGELFIATALSGASWNVPAGQVGARFRGLLGAEDWRLIPSQDYTRVQRAKGTMTALSDFPLAPAWDDNPDIRSKEVTAR